jgi:hydrogenase maturation protein HypF
MCPECSAEYGDASFRRFHAQTLSCPKDGPVYRFLDSGLKEVSQGRDAVADATSAILSGSRIIVKGWGGMHIVCDPSRLSDMRAWYKRPYKPFALMCADLETVAEFAVLDGPGLKAVNSPARPIALLRKRDDPPAWAKEGLEMASPGLDSVGVYLPYAGIHHLLFRSLREHGPGLRWLVMTSANVPGEPMGLDLEDVAPLKADGYLVHDRRIVARCDDSVVIPDPIPPGVRRSAKGPSGMDAFIIRRSRGMVPIPLAISHERSVLGLGAERNMSTTLTSNGLAYATPYLGTSRVPSALDFASEATAHYRGLFASGKLEAVVVDKHPMYETTRWGRALAKEEGVPLFEVQHHHAHAISLMADAGMDRLTSLVLDGVGWGDDGTPWGAEVLDPGHTDYRRIGHLAPFGLPGGDSAVYHPERIAYWLTRESGHEMALPDAAAAEVLERTRRSSIMTSSMGRLLDALASISLGITWRSYDGEPAMRLEALLGRSKDPATSLYGSMIGADGVVDVRERWGTLISELFGEGAVRTPDPTVRATARTADLVAGLVLAVLDDLVEVGSGSAAGGCLGISGGVAYDLPIVKAFAASCGKRGIVPVLHSKVPCGDGGISIGQAVFGGHMLG